MALGDHIILVIDGTAYEIGYAEALGKPVTTYSELRSTLLNLHISRMDAKFTGETWRDARGYLIEDFGLKTNLMLKTYPNHGPFSCAEAAIEVLARELQISYRLTHGVEA